VPDRIANLIVLVEDAEQQKLVRLYLKRCGHETRWCDFRPLPVGRGGSGEKYVRNEYHRQVQSCRSSLGRKASALLIVMIDADTETTEYRAVQLSNALRDGGEKQRGDSEPIVVLIPKRHVETWIQALLGNAVDEVTDYKKPKPAYGEILNAAETLHQWTRRNAVPGVTCPPSLTESLPEWKKIRS
jgi:hypothetical protein